jgi:hypothetical protein
MIKFKSLLIGSGDSFLVEDNESRYLIDSGGSTTLIKSLIKEKIDLAICTHNDADHSKGFIGLLSSSKHEIKEIWLPGIWASVIKFISDGKYHVAFKKDINFDEIVKPTEIDGLLETADSDVDEFTDEMSDIDSFHYYILKYRHLYYSNPIFKKVFYNIDRIILISRLAYEKGVVIKWFFPSNKEGSRIRNFKPLNSELGLKMKKIKNDDIISFFKLAYLTSQNEHSLVFEYFINGNARILFTADSILQTPRTYLKSTIVTAPHHGSDSNKITYKNISGEIIWVRSDRPSSKRPCSDFLSLKDKYCLRCTKDKISKTEKELVFEFKSDIWTNASGIKCDH